MECECLHKEFFGFGMFVMGIVYFYLEIIWSMLKKEKTQNN